jgi:hypothetical protein
MTGEITERAPLLLVFGDLAGRVAALVRARPILIARLIVAPREAVHSIGAFLHLAPDAQQPDANVATIIYETDPRELLRAALPGCPPRLYRALDRAGDRVRRTEFYSRLGAIARGPLADALLDDDQPLDADRLDYLEAVSGMDPLVAATHKALPESRYYIEAFDAVVACLRARGVLQDADFRLPPKARSAALVRRLTMALARLAAPDPGFVPPPPFRLVATTAELQDIGRRFRNCVALPSGGRRSTTFVWSMAR